jgi:DTW domain-containing protein YfiP
LTTRTRVVFLQHPRERDVPIGTVRIARLCLPESVLRVGVAFADDPVVCAAMSDPSRPAALLFPGPSARDLRTDAPAGPVTLFVLDGTWSQAAKLLKVNPQLAALPQYRLEPARPSDYRIRREPADHCVATIEALAEVLGVLEGDPARMAALLRPFKAMVDAQLAYARSNTGRPGRHRPRKRTGRRKPFPDVLTGDLSRVVLAYGEANAWPWNAAGAPAPEVVHWLARRLGTGETFEAVVAPTAGPAPSVAYHTQLPEAVITGGESFARFDARWRAFLRPGDVLCTWGRYAPDVLARQGGAVPERLDLRVATALFLGARTGAIEDCAAHLGARTGAPWAPGRGGRRMEALEAVVAAMLASAPPDLHPVE